MNNGLENILVDCLCDTLNVLLCSESSDIIFLVNSMIGRYPLYNFLKARSPDVMDLYFRQVQSWHCIILDGRCSFAGDFLNLMQNRQDWVPIIIVADTVTTDMLGSSGVIQPHLNRPVLEDGFRCSTLASGKHYAVHYPPGNLSRMSSLLQLQSIRKKLLPQRIPGAEMLSALDVLFRRNPLSVETWSGHLNSTPRKLQQLFKEYTLYTPKKLIALYHAYRIAFEAAARQDEKGKGIIPAYLLDERSRKRVMEYILSRRSQFLLA